MMEKISLSHGFHALVDTSDFPVLSGKKWYYDGRGYAFCFEQRKNIKMHRVVLGLTDNNLQVDHINGNKLDNRRSNLRVSSISNNQWNRGKSKNNKSGYKGVSWDKTKGKWQASVSADKRQYHLGLFENPDEAYAAYCKKAKELHGEFFNPG